MRTKKGIRPEVNECLEERVVPSSLGNHALLNLEFAELKHLAAQERFLSREVTAETIKLALIERNNAGNSMANILLLQAHVQKLTHATAIPSSITTKLDTALQNVISNMR